MEHIKFAKEQLISLEAKENSTVENAVAEAIVFCTINKIDGCDLFYNGYLFGIEPGSSNIEMVKEYHEACSINKEWIKE